jgi:hypothetical protein
VRSESRRRRGVGVIVLLVGAGTASCGGHRLAPPLVAPQGVATTRRPAITVPAGARLAIGTSQGMEIWSATTGVFTVGPTLGDVVVSDVAWSADGRYLSWQTVPVGGHQGAELWDADVSSGITEHWGPVPAGRTYGAVVTRASGVLTYGAVITERTSASGRRTLLPAAPDPAGGRFESWSGGWVAESAARAGELRVQRVSAAGASVPPVVVLDAPSGDGARFDLEAVAVDGRQFAAELGAHGKGCQTAGSAELWTASLTTGVVGDSTPPLAAGRVTQRFWNLDVSGPADTVYASMLVCTTTTRLTKVTSRTKATAKTKATATTRVVRSTEVADSTVLWMRRGGHWSRVGADLVAADRAGNGPLATLSGQIEVTGGVARVTGRGQVGVDGRIIAAGGQTIAWAPVGPIAGP